MTGRCARRSDSRLVGAMCAGRPCCWAGDGEWSLIRFLIEHWFACPSRSFDAWNLRLVAERDIGFG